MIVWRCLASFSNSVWQCFQASDRQLSCRRSTKDHYIPFASWKSKHMEVRGWEVWNEKIKHKFSSEYNLQRENERTELGDGDGRSFKIQILTNPASEQGNQAAECTAVQGDRLLSCWRITHTPSSRSPINIIVFFRFVGRASDSAAVVDLSHCLHQLHYKQRFTCSILSICVGQFLKPKACENWSELRANVVKSVVRTSNSVRA